MGAALQGYPASVFGYSACDDAAGAHGQTEADFVAGLPLSGDDHVAFVHDVVGGLAVHSDCYVGGGFVGVLVEVAGHWLGGGPAGSAYAEREVGAALRHAVDGDCHFAAPRVAGGLAEAECVAADGYVGAALDEEVDVGSVVVGGVDVARHGGYEAAEVAGAAGAAEPFGAGVAAGAFEGVGIEEAVAGEADAGEHSVVECALEDVVVFGFACGEEHSPVPIYVGYCGAGLVVCRAVGQLVGLSEGFAGVACSDAAGDVELAAGHVVP